MDKDFYINYDKILLVDSFILASKLNNALKILRNDNYLCHAKNTIQNAVYGNIPYTLFAIIACHKREIVEKK